jgi:hypothetical protein
MSPREAAEKRELEMLVDYIARRNFQNAGDAAELKAALEAALPPNPAPVTVVGAGPDAPGSGGGGGETWIGDYEPSAGDSHP